MHQRSKRFMAAFLTLMAVASITSAPADARRGGSFGSRGSRTYSVPRSTTAAPGYVPPIERSMTPRGAAQPSPGYNQGFGQQPVVRPAGSRFGGFGGGLIGGLIAGGLIGHFFGGGMGWGGGGAGGGFLLGLLQIAILGGIVWLVVGFFRRRGGNQSVPMGGPFSQPSGQPNGFAPQAGDSPWGGAQQVAREDGDDGIDIAVTPSDQEAFERLLIDVQDAFGREDYARLRQLTTPEIMSYLSEELSQNATQGLRNVVSETRLLDAEVSEAWHERGSDYATIVLRYVGVDVMRDRTTGAIVNGSATVPSETTELWTFVRSACDIWKLSAIQES